MNVRRGFFLAAWAVLGTTAPLLGWHGDGHDLAARRAWEALPEELPAFFRAGEAIAAYYCRDPDLFTRPVAPPALHAGEAPEHYFDLELLQGRIPPATRYEFLDLCAQQRIPPDKVGLLPYAIVEWTGRLTVAFAEYRKWPDDPILQRKCLAYAGLLSHYAADACQPLHTTIHWDGRAKADGSSPRSGLHARVDALLEKLDARAAPAGAVQVEAYGDVLRAAWAQIQAGHALVDRVYELEPALPGAEAPLAEGSPASEFARDRLGAAAGFTASLCLTAWRDSAKIGLPAWHTRPAGAAAPLRSPPGAKGGVFPWIAALLGVLAVATLAAYLLARLLRRKPRPPGSS